MSLVGYRASNHPQQVAKRGASERDNLGTDPALFTKLDARRQGWDVEPTVDGITYWDPPRWDREKPTPEPEMATTKKRRRRDRRT